MPSCSSTRSRSTKWTNRRFRATRLGKADARLLQACLEFRQPREALRLEAEAGQMVVARERQQPFARMLEQAAAVGGVLNAHHVLQHLGTLGDHVGPALEVFPGEPVGVLVAEG